MKLAYQDRAFYLGDPDFNDIDVDYLGSQEHISKKIKKLILIKLLILNYMRIRIQKITATQLIFL